MTIQDYLGLVTSEHSNKPNFMGWLTANLQMVEDNTIAAASMIGAFDVNTAIGNQLDVVGLIVGQPRNIGVPITGASSVLDDDHYRLVLKARTARNNWDGTIPSIYEIWNNAFPVEPLQLIDNQDMTMQAIITNLTDIVSQELVTAGFVIPQPIGVGLSIISVTPIAQEAYLGATITGGDIVSLTIA